MNAPHFNMKNLPSPFGSVEWTQEMINEEKRCCGQIDARLNQLENESQNLNAQLSTLEAEVANNTFGFFEGISIRIKMHKIAKEIEWRRRVIIKLLNARIVRTLGK